MMINLSYMLNQFIVDITMILSVAFFTLLERKTLSYMQNRKGPNKISIIGLAQPLSDAMKLLTKNEFKLTFSNNMMYWIPPFYSFFLFIFIINLYPNKYNISESNLGWLEFFCFIALLSFSAIMMGWASNSKYTMLGSLRNLAQSISYEVILMMSVFVFLFFFNTLNINYMYKEKLMLNLMMMLMMMIVLISLICEVNRAPFDLAEGESELVSGFNTEYGMTKFSLIFLTEYGMMIFMGIIMVSIMNNFTNSVLLMKILMVMILFLWFRASYPRIRYDVLMFMTWKNILPFMIYFSIFLILIL